MVIDPKYCEHCPLKGNKQVGPEGDYLTAKYIFVGEAPGREEVAGGRPFIGVSGKLLRKMWERTGISPDECYITNVCKCKAPGNKVPPKALAACRHNLLNELIMFERETPIVALGGSARDALMPYLAGQGVLGTRGWHTTPGGRTVLVTVHPAYIVYNPNNAPMLFKDLVRLKRGRHPPVTVDYDLLDTLPKLQEWVSRQRSRWAMDKEPRFVAFDLETDQVDYHRDRILCIGIGYDEGLAAIIPDSLIYEDGMEWWSAKWTEGMWKQFLTDPRYRKSRVWEPNPEVVKWLEALFECPNVRWVAHNSKFDLRFLQGQLGIFNARVDFDTIVAHYTLDERRGGHALKGLADEWYDTGDYEGELLGWVGKKGGRYSKCPRELLYEYNAMDAEVTRRLAIDFEQELKQQGLYEKPFLFPMMAAIPTLLAMEIRGVLVDNTRLDVAETRYLIEEERLTATLRRLGDAPDLNPRSVKQLRPVMFETLGIPKIAVRTRSRGAKKGAGTTCKEAIDQWIQMYEKDELTTDQGEFVTALRDYRHAQKMRGSYVKNLRKFQGLHGRVHTSYLLRGTVTGRLAAKDPAMQTIPSDPRDELGMMIANSLVPEEGWSFLYADYSQMELRILACMSGDPVMIEAFTDISHGRVDFHSSVAREFFGPDFTPRQRSWYVKRAVFGWAYGGNVFEIIRDALGVDESKARWFADEWATKFEVCNQHRKELAALMLKQGYIESVFGRRRRFPLITRNNRIEAMLAAGNMPMQSGAADVLLVASIRLHDMYKDSGYAYPVLNIHDALVMEVRNDKVDEVSKTMRHVMEATAEEHFPQVPFIADVLVGGALGAFKEFKDAKEQS
jgi:DNA polymerase-1